MKKKREKGNQGDKKRKKGRKNITNMKQFSKLDTVVPFVNWHYTLKKKPIKFKEREVKYRSECPTKEIKLGKDNLLK